MKYYDRELQDAWNSETADQARLARANQKSRLLLASYHDQLHKLRARMSARAYQLFSSEKYPLFDSNLLSFTVGDGTAMHAAGIYSTRFRTGIEAKFLNFQQDGIYTLAYRGIGSLSVDVPNDKWFDPDDDIGCLLWHEITAAGAKFLNHEMLFTSGATIKIKFEKVLVSKHKVKKSK